MNDKELLGLLSVERERLPTDGLHDAMAVVERDMGEGYYTADFIALSDSVSSPLLPCRARLAVVFDKAPDTLLSRGDTLIFTVGVTDMERLSVSPRSRLGMAYKKGMRQVATVYDRHYAVSYAPVERGLVRWAAKVRRDAVSRIGERPRREG